MIINFGYFILFFWLYFFAFIKFKKKNFFYFILCGQEFSIPGVWKSIDTTGIIFSSEPNLEFSFSTVFLCDSKGLCLNKKFVSVSLMTLTLIYSYEDESGAWSKSSKGRVISSRFQGRIIKTKPDARIFLTWSYFESENHKINFSC